VLKSSGLFTTIHNPVVCHVFRQSCRRLSEIEHH